MLGTSVQEIDGVAFEQPENRDESLLGDNAAFDAFISSTTLRVGIEVKFTEFGKRVREVDQVACGVGCATLSQLTRDIATFAPGDIWG